MAHFNVTVLVPGRHAPGSQHLDVLVATALAPYDEARDTEPYPVPLASDPFLLTLALRETAPAAGPAVAALRARAEELDALARDGHIPDLAPIDDLLDERTGRRTTLVLAHVDPAEIVAALTESGFGEEFAVVDGEAARMSVANPNGRWDSWTIGGRWSGEWAVPAKEAGAESPEDDVLPVEELRRRLPGMADELIGVHGAGKTAGQRAEIAANAGTTYALVDRDGRWHAAAEAGLFLSEHNRTMSREEWLATWARLIAEAPADTTAVMVDCHT